MITRTEYLNGQATFLAYYLDVASAAGIQNLERTLAAKVDASNGPPFNDIPIQVWDGHAQLYRGRIAAALKARGDFWSWAGGLCTLKALAQARWISGGRDV